MEIIWNRFHGKKNGIIVDFLYLILNNYKDLHINDFEKKIS